MAAKPVKVLIAYCSDCGYEPYTIALTNHLMVAFADKLSSIELIPWHDGSFDVSVAGKLIHSMYREGGFPEHETIDVAVREALAATEA
jgi:selenoprotein W-related protein